MIHLRGCHEQWIGQKMPSSAEAGGRASGKWVRLGPRRGTPRRYPACAGPRTRLNGAAWSRPRNTTTRPEHGWSCAGSRGDPVPADLARILGPERLKSLMAVYGVWSSEQWQRKIDNAHDVLKDELWQCFLDTGLSIDKAEVAMAMMKAGMFPSCGRPIPGRPAQGSDRLAEEVADHS